jgi:Tfp pilus assembly protein PilP
MIRSRVAAAGLSAVLVMALALFLGVASAAVGQESEEGQAEETPATVSVDRLLEEDDFTLAGEGYTYDSGGRRDPFKSLLVVRQGEVERGPRPDGIPGLLIEEIDLTGIFVTAEGPVAQVQSTQSEISHLLHEGDQLYDGDVVSIGTNEVVFKQIVDDPTAVKPFREVVKKLNP